MSQHESDILQNIEHMRKKLDDVWTTMNVTDFERIHAKFFGAVISIEEGFRKRFPTEWERYEKKFYGDH